MTLCARPIVFPCDEVHGRLDAVDRTSENPVHSDRDAVDEDRGKGEHEEHEVVRDGSHANSLSVIRPPQRTAGSSKRSWFVKASATSMNFSLGIPMCARMRAMCVPMYRDGKRPSRLSSSRS